MTIGERQETLQTVPQPVYNISLPENAFTKDAIPVWLTIGLIVCVVSVWVSQ